MSASAQTSSSTKPGVPRERPTSGPSRRSNCPKTPAEVRWASPFGAVIFAGLRETPDKTNNSASGLAPGCVRPQNHRRSNTAPNLLRNPCKQFATCRLRSFMIILPKRILSDSVSAPPPPDEDRRELFLPWFSSPWQCPESITPDDCAIRTPSVVCWASPPA